MLEELKKYLKITWDYEDYDLQKMIERAEGSLEDLTGTKLNFEEEGPTKILLFNHCRYDYNNSLEYFEENFQKEILRLQLKEAVKNRVKQK